MRYAAIFAVLLVVPSAFAQSPGAPPDRQRLKENLNQEFMMLSRQLTHLAEALDAYERAVDAQQATSDIPKPAK